jgi:ABC transport system ATP-binding/permease protein
MTQRDRAQKIRDAAQAQSGKTSNQNGQQPAQNVREALLKSEQAATTTAPAQKKARKLSFKEQREFDALPAKIANLEAELAKIGRQLHDGSLYAKDPALAAQLAQRSTAIDDELLACLEQQEALS